MVYEGGGHDPPPLPLSKKRSRHDAETVARVPTSFISVEIETSASPTFPLKMKAGHNAPIDCWPARVCFNGARHTQLLALAAAS